MQEIRHVEIESSADTQSRYNEIFAAEGLPQLDSYYLWLISLLNPEPGRRLLDISCGTGRLVHFAAARGLRAVGIDFAFQGVRSGAGETPEAGWSVGDGEQLPLAADSVDYVTHIGSLEHYEDPSAGAREISRVLKPDGTACILLPNSYGLFGNIGYVMKTGQIWDDGQPLQRYNTRIGWLTLLEQGGLKIFRTLRYERVLPRTWADMAWYLRSPRKLLRALAAPLVPLNLANCHVFLCRPDAG